MSLRALLAVYVEPESLAFKKHTVIIDQHRAVNEFESAFAVILEMSVLYRGCWSSCPRGTISKRSSTVCPCVILSAVGHHLHRERIGLLHIEVVGTGSHGDNDCEKEQSRTRRTGRGLGEYRRCVNRNL